MKVFFPTFTVHLPPSAPMVVAAVLMVGLLTKFGFGWWGIAVIAVLCLLDGMRKQNAAIPPVGDRAASPSGRGSELLASTTH
jgi:hypothetical protein